MAVAPGFAAVVAKSTKHSYSDYGMKWDNSGKNASTLGLLIHLRQNPCSMIKVEKKRKICPTVI
jgi:hypothetical protein